MGFWPPFGLLASLCLGFLSCSSAAVSAQQPIPATAPGYLISVFPDRGDATYRTGDLVTFSVLITKDGKPVDEGSVNWSLTNDGVAPIQSGTAPIHDGMALVSGKLASPGFLQCKIAYTARTGVARGLGAAAIDPLKIGASLPVPDDFDEFWAAKKLELSKVPMNARLTPIAKATPGIELFEVQADAVGDRPMSGYYARPAGAKPKSLPAIITLEGAGVYGTRQEPWLNGWARDGFLSLELNAHGLPSGQPVGYYQDLEKGALKDYQFFGRESRDTSYFLDMYLRDLRGLDFLTSQPEWDGRVLVSSGASQGGAQAIFLAAEDPRVTFLAAAVPAMCDHSAMLAGRVVGWPRLVPLGADGKPDPAILEASRYFDSMNFATRIHVPAFFIIGYIDQIAPPSSGYAAYNNLPGKKELFPAICSPHRIGPEVWQQFRNRILQEKN